MGKRPAEDELFEGNMGSIQREIRTSMQREDEPTMETGLERIAAKARSEPKLRFTSLAHHNRAREFRRGSNTQPLRRTGDCRGRSRRHRRAYREANP